MQVTYLEVHIRNELVSQPVATSKEAALAALACIVVACSARLEALDLRLEWCCTDSCAQNLLVRHSLLSPYILCLGCYPPKRSSTTLAELEELLSWKSCSRFWCLPWQHAAALCGQLQSLHLEVQSTEWAPSSPSWGEEAYGI